MKAVGFTMAFLGSIAALGGFGVLLLSLRNLNDLHMWFGLGLCVGIPGVVLALIGWRLGSDDNRSSNDGDSSSES